MKFIFSRRSRKMSKFEKVDGILAISASYLNVVALINRFQNLSTSLPIVAISTLLTERFTSISSSQLITKCYFHGDVKTLLKFHSPTMIVLFVVSLLRSGNVQALREACVEMSVMGLACGHLILLGKYLRFLDRIFKR